MGGGGSGDTEYGLGFKKEPVEYLQ